MMNKNIYNELVTLYNKYCEIKNELSEEEFFEQLIFYMINLMKNKQKYTEQYKNNPEVLLNGFYKFIELKD